MNIKQIIIILAIVYVFLCLILVAIQKFKAKKNPIIFVDEITQIIENEKKKHKVYKENEILMKEIKRMS